MSPSSPKVLTVRVKQTEVSERTSITRLAATARGRAVTPRAVSAALALAATLLAGACADPLTAPVQRAGPTAAPASTLNATVTSGVLGTVSAGGVNARTGAGSYWLLRTLAGGTSVTIACTATGPSVTGPTGTTSVWDRLTTGEYVTAAYVKTASAPPVAAACPSNPTTIQARGDDYPYRTSAMNLDDRWGFWTRQCTSFVAYRLNQNGIAFNGSFGGTNWGSAYHWDDAARAIGLRVDHTPSPGSVAQLDAYAYGSYGYGHVAYVVGVKGDGSIVVEDYNWGSPSGTYHLRTLPGYKVSNYIHFR